MKVNQKNIKEKLQEWATCRGKVDTLMSQKDAEIAPFKAAFDKKSAKITAQYADNLNLANADLFQAEKELKAELGKGFDALTNEFAVTKVESELAIIEVKTTESREINPEAWLKEIPKAKQNGEFWKTLKVQIGEAVNQFSESVNKLATKKRSHQVIVRLK